MYNGSDKAKTRSELKLHFTEHLRIANQYDTRFKRKSRIQFLPFDFILIWCIYDLLSIGKCRYAFEILLFGKTKCNRQMNSCVDNVYGIH